jgi:phospholipid/cholesterol/gamma-HCH transport system substrate-binding protein
MSRNAVETVMGAVVLVVAAVFLFFAYTTSTVRTFAGGYNLTARFDHVEGLRDGSDVRISGIKVGQVVSQTLDPQTFQAVIKISVDSSIKLPVDTVATIDSTGLLGDKFLSLVPGNEETMLAPGGTIEHTQSPVSLESLIGRYIFSQQPTQGAAAAPAPAPAPAPSSAAGAPSGHDETAPK